MTDEATEQNVNDMDARAAADLARAERASVVTIRVAHYEGPDWTPVERGVTAGTLASIPVMLDFGIFRPERPFQELVLKKLHPGNIYPISFWGRCRC
jgi:dihydroorotase